MTKSGDNVGVTARLKNWRILIYENYESITGQIYGDTLVVLA